MKFRFRLRWLLALAPPSTAAAAAEPGNPGLHPADLKHTLSMLLIDDHGRIVHRVDGSQWMPDDFLKRR